MDHRQAQGGIPLLFSDRRQHSNPAVPDLENSFIGVAVAVSDFDTTQSFDGDLGHFVGDSVVAVASQAINTGPHQEMRADLLGRAEKLVDVDRKSTRLNSSH